MKDTASLEGSTLSAARVRWVDYAKGICIIFVVMMWCTIDYQHNVGTEGWLNYVVAFARPFRMPDFFLLSGLFLYLSINSPTREYMDRKVIHFIYFYLLWLAIQMGLTEAGLLISNPVGFFTAFAIALIEPINTLWFVHMLALYYIVTRALRRVPKLIVFTGAALLQTLFTMGLLDTGWGAANRFVDHYVYFYAGYAASPWIFAFARRVAAHQMAAVGALLAWGVVNGWLTYIGIDQAPLISLALGFAGAAAVVSVGSLLAERRLANWLAYCGTYSIVIYLTAFLPMKVMIKALSGSGIVPDVGTAAAIITFVAVAVPLLFHRLIKGTWLNFLYVRPDAFRLRNVSRSAARKEESGAVDETGVIGKSAAR